MAETRTYELHDDITVAELGTRLEGYLMNSLSLRTQKFDSGDRAVIQCSSTGSEWKQFLGLNNAITVELRKDGSVLTATVGSAKWMDKAGTAVVGAIIFSPLLLTTAFGALQQSMLPVQIFEFIEGTLSGRQANHGAAYEAGSVTQYCPRCGRKLAGDETFCPGCGEKI